ncbi:MAG: flagellar protein FlbT [Gemmatimonadetes bacterium]|nr:flagellar protein FlbT [Gemmatimonadota bacterium]
MPLRISLRAGERLIVGGAVVRNGGHRCDLVIENDVPILRGKDVLSLDEASSPCKRIQFAIQLMYVDPEHRSSHRTLLRQLVAEVLEASPSMRQLIEEIDDKIAAGQYYQALRLGRQLILYEQELISHAVARR